MAPDPSPSSYFNPAFSSHNDREAAETSPLLEVLHQYQYATHRPSKIPIRKGSNPHHKHNDSGVALSPPEPLPRRRPSKVLRGGIYNTVIGYGSAADEIMRLQHGRSASITAHISGRIADFPRGSGVYNTVTGRGSLNDTSRNRQYASNAVKNVQAETISRAADVTHLTDILEEKQKGISLDEPEFAPRFPFDTGAPDDSFLFKDPSVDSSRDLSPILASFPAVPRPLGERSPGSVEALSKGTVPSSSIPTDAEVQDNPAPKSVVVSKETFKNFNLEEHPGPPSRDDTTRRSVDISPKTYARQWTTDPKGLGESSLVNPPQPPSEPVTPAELRMAQESKVPRADKKQKLFGLFYFGKDQPKDSMPGFERKRRTSSITSKTRNKLRKRSIKDSRAERNNLRAQTAPTADPRRSFSEAVVAVGAGVLGLLHHERKENSVHEGELTALQQALHGWSHASPASPALERSADHAMTPILTRHLGGQVTHPGGSGSAVLAPVEWTGTSTPFEHPREPPIPPLPPQFSYKQPSQPPHRIHHTAPGPSSSTIPNEPPQLPHPVTVQTHLHDIRDQFDLPTTTTTPSISPKTLPVLSTSHGIDETASIDSLIADLDNTLHPHDHPSSCQPQSQQATGTVTCLTPSPAPEIPPKSPSRLSQQRAHQPHQPQQQQQHLAAPAPLRPAVQTYETLGCSPNLGDRQHFSRASSIPSIATDAHLSSRHEPARGEEGMSEPEVEDTIAEDVLDILSNPRESAVSPLGSRSVSEHEGHYPEGGGEEEGEHLAEVRRRTGTSPTVPAIILRPPAGVGSAGEGGSAAASVGSVGTDQGSKMSKAEKRCTVSALVPPLELGPGPAKTMPALLPFEGMEKEISYVTRASSIPTVHSSRMPVAEEAPLPMPRGEVSMKVMHRCVFCGRENDISAYFRGLEIKVEKQNED